MPIKAIDRDATVLDANARRVVRKSRPQADAEDFNEAAEKIDKQLRRYKRRLKDRHDQTTHAQRQEDAAYVLFREDAEVAEPSEAPVVIAETRVDVPEATVSDAVMMLDLRNTNALLFKNAGTGRHNMVYRRGDGSIGWVEPT